MPLFGYEAIDGTGRTLRGTLEADSEQLLISRLHEQGCMWSRWNPRRRGARSSAGFANPKSPNCRRWSSSHASSPQ
jgi:type II secretory pathway component PulF